MPPPSASPASHDGLPVPRRYWAIAAIALAITMSVLDSTIVNVALPTIARELHASAAASIWVINAYQLAILMLLLPLASLGEIVGYRRVAQTGLAVFTLASLGCAFAPDLLTLSIARIVQGLGAAGIMSVSGALVRFTYPHRYLGRAVGINAFVVATSAALGPTIASAVLAVAHWRWLFGINVPLGILTIAIALYALPDNERSQRRFNLAAAVLCAGAFGLLLSGLQSLAHHSAAPLALAADRRWRPARGAAGQTRAAAARTDRAIRPAARPPVLAVDRDLGVLVHGTDGRAGGAAVRDSAPRTQRRGHRTVHDSLAAGAGPGRAARGAPGGSARGGIARRAGAPGPRRRPRPARGVPRRRQHHRLRVAHGPVRPGLRFLPGSQQPHHHGRRAALRAVAPPAAC